jgi:hypothetical protein
MIQLLDADFIMWQHHEAAAYQALMAFYEAAQDHPYFEDSFPQNLGEAAHLEDFLDRLGYMVTRDGDGHIDSIDIFGDNEYIGDEYLFAVLAPFVRPGSFMEVQILDHFFRWEFNGQGLLEFEGQICYSHHQQVRPEAYQDQNLPDDEEGA